MVAFGFLAPKFWEVVGTYELSFLFKNECSFSGGDNILANIFFELYTPLGGGDPKTL